jgi:hypothetical protein
MIEKMKMIDNIEMDFKSVGFGDFEKNWNEEDTTQYNSYSVKVSYNGKSLTELYGNKWYDELKPKVEDKEMKHTMKIDILNHIVSDCNVPDSFEYFVSKIKEFEMTNGVKLTIPLREVFDTSSKQMKKYIDLFGENGIEDLRKALIEYRDKVPESKILIRFDESWTEMFRDGNIRVETDDNAVGIRRVENER